MANSSNLRSGKIYKDVYAGSADNCLNVNQLRAVFEQFSVLPHANDRLSALIYGQAISPDIAKISLVVVLQFLTQVYDLAHNNNRRPFKFMTKQDTTDFRVSWRMRSPGLRPPCRFSTAKHGEEIPTGISRRNI